MFKKLIQRIIDAENQEAAWRDVFYGEDGIDLSYQRGRISYKEHEMLRAFIEKMA